MTHAFATRMTLAGAVPMAPVDPERVKRMEDQGWDVSQPFSGVDVGTTGMAGFVQTQARMICGLAFLENRAAVQVQLGLNQAQLDAKCDLELLLDLRIHQGPAFAQDVAGSFSIAFFDHQSGSIEVYRDHFGIYPLYYAVQDGALTCASDLRACIHLSGAAVNADPIRVADFIQGEDVDVDRTAFDGISRLPPAHCLTLESGDVIATRYWQLEMPEPHTGKDGVAKLRAALGSATAACVASPGAVGAMLSGGLDSSALVGLAAPKATDLDTLSFVYGQDKAYDETPYIDAANKAFKTTPHKIPVAAGVPLDALGPVVEEQMDLFLAPGLAKSRQIYAEARGLGLDAVIDGHGGDEVISHGYGRLVELAAHQQFWRLFLEARGAAKVHGVPLIALVAGHIGRYGGLRARHPIRRALMKIARVLSRKSHVPNGVSSAVSLIAPELQETANIETRYTPVSLLKTEADFKQAASITHLGALTDPLIIQAFEVLHRSATAAGVLPRYPFFDQRVVSLCLSLPSNMKLRGGRTRWVLREAMQGILPDMIRLRVDKAEFGRELQDTVIAFYRDADSTIFAPLSPYVDTARAERLRENFVSGAVANVDSIRALWRLAVLIQWVAAYDRWRIAQAKGMLI